MEFHLLLLSEGNLFTDNGGKGRFKIKLFLHVQSGHFKDCTSSFCNYGSEVWSTRDIFHYVEGTQPVSFSSLKERVPKRFP